MSSGNPDAARYDRVRTIFADALDLPPAERDAFVRFECRDDQELCDQVLSLLAKVSGSDLLHTTTPGGRVRRAVDHLESLAERDESFAEEMPLPERIGTCLIVGRLGEGGMGVVYQGEQQSPKRRVAVKLMRADAWSTSLISRFRREAELLGRLEHPGIARVYEAGHARPWGAKGPELPYLVMEYVDGSPVTAYAARHSLGPRQRLALLGLICDAVQHAHERGVVHRDLKPANVLVDTLGQPRVLDFGVARALEGDSGFTAATGTSQLVGTLPYMSPEQLSGKPGAVGPPSDVYALGVVAYELLAGRRPIPVAGLSLAEAVRQVQEVDPPRLGLVDPRLSGDIEAIVGKALDKEPERRYQSAAAMSADIQRYLAEQPIHARPPSAVYRASKFVRRHTAVVSVMACLVLVLAAGIATTTWLALRESRARREADQSADSAKWLSYTSGLAAALGALDASDARAARAHLDASPASMRDWTWAHVSSRLDDAAAKLELGAPSGFDDARIVARADGRIVVPLKDGIALVGVCSGSLVLERTLKGTFVAVSNDGQRALEHSGGRWIDRSLGSPGRSTASSLPESIDLGSAGDQRAFARAGGGWVLTAQDGDAGPALRVHDAAGKVLLSLPVPLEGTCALSGDDRFLATTRENRLLLVELTEGGRIRDLDSRVGSATFSGNGELLVTADKDGLCDSWRVADGSPGPWTAVPIASVPVNILVTGPGCDGFVSIDQRGTVRSWSSADGALEKEVAEVGYFRHALALSSGCSRVALAQSTGGLRVVELGGHGPDVQCVGPVETLGPIAFLPGDRRQVAIDRGGWLRLFPEPERRASRRLFGHTSFVYDVALDGASRAASAAWDGTVRVWDVRTGAIIRVLPLPDYIGRIVGLTSDGVVLGCMNRVTIAWDIADGHEVDRIEDLAVRMLNPLGESGRVAFAAEEGPIGWWNPRTGQKQTLVTVPRERDEPRWAVTKSMRHIAWARGHVVVFIALPDDFDAATSDDIPASTQRWSVEVPCDTVLSVDVAPDGGLVAAACNDGALLLLDARDGSMRTELAPRGGTPLYAARFHPDGTMLATGSRDGTLATWSPTRGDLIAQMRYHKDYIHGIAFSPDGTFLATASADTTVGIWTTQTTAALAANR